MAANHQDVKNVVEPASPKTNDKSNIMKYVALFCLVIQTAVAILLLRYVRTRPGEKFSSSTAVVVGEFVKIISCLCITFYQFKGNCKKWIVYLWKEVVVNWVDTLKTAVPALMYMIQNNLLFVALSNLPAATYQVSYQLKILTTAMFSVAMLGKSLSKSQWLSMILLFIGVAIVQFQVQSDKVKLAHKSNSDNTAFGLIAVVLSSLTSGFAGVYFEKILKGSSTSLWLRNIQLGLFGAVSGLIGVLVNDRAQVFKKGFFFGYTPVVYLLILIQAGGGLLVAVVIKYADNILKGFATSISIVLSTIAAVVFFGFELTLMFLLGAGLVILAIYIYSLPKHQPSPLLSTTKYRTPLEDV